MCEKLEEREREKTRNMKSRNLSKLQKKRLPHEVRQEQPGPVSGDQVQQRAEEQQAREADGRPEPETDFLLVGGGWKRRGERSERGGGRKRGGIVNGFLALSSFFFSSSPNSLFASLSSPYPRTLSRSASPGVPS